MHIRAEDFGEGYQRSQARIRGRAGIGLALFELSVGERCDVRRTSQSLLAKPLLDSQSMKSRPKLPRIAIPRVCGSARSHGPSVVKSCLADRMYTCQNLHAHAAHASDMGGHMSGGGGGITITEPTGIRRLFYAVLGRLSTFGR
jgi:hypothetical protein